MSKWDEARTELEAVSEEWWQSAEELNVVCSTKPSDIQALKRVIQRREQILARGQEALRRYIKISGDRECRLIAVEMPFWTWDNPRPASHQS